MARLSLQVPSPCVRSLVHELLREDDHYQFAERRGATRTPLVRPALIRLHDDPGGEIDAFTKDVSDTGLCLVCQFEMPNSAMADLTVHHLQQAESIVLAECRWNRTYGDFWYLSGWRLIKIQD
jgi:hypothetical protein